MMLRHRRTGRRSQGQAQCRSCHRRSSILRSAAALLQYAAADDGVASSGFARAPVGDGALATVSSARERTDGQCPGSADLLLAD
jgi:hypothetical protein